MDNLATVLDDQGKYEEAEEMSRQALGLKEKVLGKEHPSTLTSMNNLALVYRNGGRWDEAEKLEMEMRLRARTRISTDADQHGQPSLRLEITRSR
jgi:tetratricopeptide (TPR) repeat protein